MKRVERLPTGKESPGQARDLVRTELLGCDGEAVAAAELMVSELVTNAVVHGSSPIEMELTVEGNVIRATVTDAGRGRPVPRTARPSDPHGRGLHILGSIAHEWGIDAGGAGTSVWFTLPCEFSPR